ncbi:uncharacterized mitochondrial protein-like protein [Tanacetum coccineum]
MAPRAVLMKIGLKSVNTARPVNTVRSVNTGRPFSTARSFNTIRPSYTAHPKSTVHCARPRTYFQNQAQSTVHRPFYKRTALTKRCYNQRFNTGRQNVNTVRARGFNVVKPSACWVWRPIKPNGASLSNSQLNDKGFVDSGCSRHMTGNIAHLSDFKDFDGGYVTFSGGAYGGRITGKGTIKTDNLDFDDVYFVKELKFNLFSVSQMCDKKNYVLFTDSECLVLSPNFKLLDENQILLKIPRQDNMYSFDMKNIVPKDSLTYLVAKATSEESMLWHRRLGHINFKNINKLVKENLNIVLIVKPHNKTPYELFRGFKPAKGFMKPFGIQGVSESSTSSQQDQDCINNAIWTGCIIFSKECPKTIAECSNSKIKKGYRMSLSTEKSPEDSSLKDNGTAYQQVNIASPEVNTGSRDVSTTVPEVTTATPEDLVGPSHASEDTQVEVQGIELGNIPQSYAVPTTPHTRIHKDHPIKHVIGNVQLFVQTRRMKTSYPEQGFLRFEDPDHPDKVLRGKIDQTLFIKRKQGHILLVQIYVDDIIFGSTKKELCDEFEKLMKDKFFNDYYGRTYLIFGFTDLEKPLVQDGDAIDEHLYRSMIGSLMYLTASRPDIMFAVCACARFQVSPKTSHLLVVKRIFRYLKGKPSLGLWYSKESPLELVAYTDSDYAGATQDRKSTTRGCQFLGNRLISWQCKKQTVVATST